jgi:hypothetical protein
MIKRAFFVALGFLGVCFPIAAQQANRPEEKGQTATLALNLYRPEISSSTESYSLLLPSGPALPWLDGVRLPILSPLAEMGIVPLDPLQFALLSAAPARAKKGNAAPAYQSDGKNFATDGKDSSGDMVNSPLHQVYWGGEVGVFYGQWSGKHGGDIMQTCITGSVGNEKFQITAGAAYEQWSGSALRLRSFGVPR